MKLNRIKHKFLSALGAVAVLAGINQKGYVKAKLCKEDVMAACAVGVLVGTPTYLVVRGVKKEIKRRNEEMKRREDAIKTANCYIKLLATDLKNVIPYYQRDLFAQLIKCTDDEQLENWQFLVVKETNSRNYDSKTLEKLICNLRKHWWNICKDHSKVANKLTILNEKLKSKKKEEERQERKRKEEERSKKEEKHWKEMEKIEKEKLETLKKIAENKKLN